MAENQGVVGCQLIYKIFRVKKRSRLMGALFFASGNENYLKTLIKNIKLFKNFKKLFSLNLKITYL